MTGAAGQNKQHFITKNTAKLDRETEELHHDRVSLEVGKVIQQGRQSKGLTQKDLATVSAAPASEGGHLSRPLVGSCRGMVSWAGSLGNTASLVSDVPAASVVREKF